MSELTIHQAARRGDLNREQEIVAQQPGSVKADDEFCRQFPDDTRFRPVVELLRSGTRRDFLRFGTRSPPPEAGL